MIEQIFFFSISIIFLVIATFTDLKQRIVPNKLNYGMFGIGLLANAALAFLKADLMIFVFCIGAIAIAFAFSWLFWKLGVWAGGDVKLFLAIAALNPLNPNLLSTLGIIDISWLKTIQLPIFPITLFVFSVFAMMPVGIILGLRRLNKNPEIKKELFLDLKKKFFSSTEFGIAIIGISSVLLFLNIPFLYSIKINLFLFELPVFFVTVEALLLFVYGLVKKKIFRIPIAVLLFCFALLQNWLAALQWFFYLLALFLGAFLLLKIFFVSKKLMRKKIKISELEEGIIVSETLVEQDGKIIKAPEFEIKKIINYIMHNRLQELKENMNPKGRIIVSSANARGLEENEIKELQKLAKEKKIEDSIMIRESVPFVPAVLVAFIILNITGDLLWNWISLL